VDEAMAAPAAVDTPKLALEGVFKRYPGNELPAVRDLTLSVQPGETLVLLGPSGCGKTTVLRLVAGLEEPDAGRILVDGRAVAGDGLFVPPERRQIGMVFQDYALLPHLSVRDNVAFGLHRLDRADAMRRATEALRLVGLEGLAERYPHQLSGGQQQRVALARALAPRPVLVLLDEPFSNLDADRRQHLRGEVREILREAGATAVFVTHDQAEALHIADRIAVMRAGAIEQVGTPDEVFLRPRNRFVAAFLGEAMFLPGRGGPDGIETELGRLDQALALPPGAEIDLLVRPDDIRLRADASAAPRVESRLFQGMTARYVVRLPSGRAVSCLTTHALTLAPGDAVRVELRPEHPLVVFERQVDPPGG
jgi:iron(III) transport system ATP-binding protein